MKKILLILLVMVVVFSVVATAAPRVKLMRLYVVNKSDYDAFLKMYDITLEQPYEYYFSIPKTGALPTEKVFTIPMGIYYVDAIYCNSEWVTKYTDLNLFRSEFTIPVTPCEQKGVKDAVADGVLKLNVWLYPPVDLLDRPIIYNLGGIPFDYEWNY